MDFPSSRQVPGEEGHEARCGSVRDYARGQTWKKAYRDGLECEGIGIGGLEKWHGVSEEEPEPELVPVRLIRGSHEMDVDGMMVVWWLEGLMRRKYLISALEMLRRWRAR